MFHLDRVVDHLPLRDSRAAVVVVLVIVAVIIIIIISYEIMLIIQKVAPEFKSKLVVWATFRHNKRKLSNKFGK
jgi:hypothetical protein